MNLIWLNDENLNPENPIIRSKTPDDKIIFIWDEFFFKEMYYGEKKLKFIQEALNEIETLEIIEGKIEAVLKAEIDTNNYKQIITSKSINHILKKIITSLSSTVEFKIYDNQDLFNINPNRDFKRFFQFWNYYKKQL